MTYFFIAKYTFSEHFKYLKVVSFDVRLVYSSLYHIIIINISLWYDVVALYKVKKIIAPILSVLNIKISCVINLTLNIVYLFVHQRGQPPHSGLCRAFGFLRLLLNAPVTIATIVKCYNSISVRLACLTLLKLLHVLWHYSTNFYVCLWPPNKY